MNFLLSGRPYPELAYKIASRQSADGISYTKSLPNNPRMEFRVQNCFPTIRGRNFAHKIASRQPADGISRTKSLPDNPRTEFRARNCSFGLLDKILLSRIHVTDKARPTSPLIAVQTVAGRRGSRPLMRSEAVDYRIISLAVCVCMPSP